MLLRPVGFGVHFSASKSVASHLRAFLPPVFSAARLLAHSFHILWFIFSFNKKLFFRALLSSTVKLGRNRDFPYSPCPDSSTASLIFDTPTGVVCLLMNLHHYITTLVHSLCQGYECCTSKNPFTFISVGFGEEDKVNVIQNSPFFFFPRSHFFFKLFFSSLSLMPL